MCKAEVVALLREKLCGLPEKDIEERVGFYAEMIDDRMEEGLTEAVAVADMGDVEDVVSQILAETPLARLVKEKIKPKRRLRAWEIVLLALGSPIWLALLISVFAVVLSLYVSTWAVVVSLWACFASFAASALGGIVGGAALVLFHGPVGLVLIAAGVFVVETLSVMMQVVYFKLSGGKRLFRMAPLHHHFEKGGWGEWRVVATFVAASAVFAVIALLGR